MSVNKDLRSDILDRTLAEYLGTRRGADGAVRFAVGRELHGAFGGAFGGVLAACTIIAARDLEPDRVPVGLDIRFLRGVPAGDIDASAEVVHHGRSLSVIGVDLHAGRHVVRATVSMVDPAALHPLDHELTAAALPMKYDDAPPWRAPADRQIPILTTLAPRILGRVGEGIASAIRVPWEPDERTAAEAACFAADLSVGPPVGAACIDKWVPHPNPDLSLRFAGSVPVEREVVGVGRVARIASGTAMVDLEVQSGGAVVAVGTATSLLLATEGSPR